MGPYSRSRSVENVHEFIRWAKHGKTDTVRRMGLKWKQEARKNSLRRFHTQNFNSTFLPIDKYKLNVE